MKVWIGYECEFDGCTMWRDFEKVFDCEVKAFLWTEEKEATELMWREIEEREVE